VFVMLTPEQIEAIKRLATVRASLSFGYLKDCLKVVPTKRGFIAVMLDYPKWPSLSAYVDDLYSGGAGH